MKSSLKFLFAVVLFITIYSSFTSSAQDVMSADRLWTLGRVGAECISADGKSLVFGVSIPDVSENKSKRFVSSLNLETQKAMVISKSEDKKSDFKVVNATTTLFKQKGSWYLADANFMNEKKIMGLPEEADNVKVSADLKNILFTKEVKVEKITGADNYKDLQKSNVKIYNSLNYRHWDEYEDGSYSHVFVAPLNGDVVETNAKDIMLGQKFDCPQKPHGGSEDVIFSPDGKAVIYVTKAKSGTAYAISTNTDIFWYDLATATLKNVSEGMMGYDVAPQFSNDGKYLAWLSMKRDGFEADKNNIHVWEVGTTNSTDVTANFDESTNGFLFSKNSANKIYFTAYTDGTEQIYSVDFGMPAPNIRLKQPTIQQITKGDFDVNGMVGEIVSVDAKKVSSSIMIVSRTDMNHAVELYSVNLSDGSMQQLTHVNDAIYASLKLSKVERKWFTATDGKKLMTWVIYPPDFDAKKKYPTLLYCQGGPQSALSQFYSFRWNFQLMAAEGYIVVAPNRRGMPGHGTAWNEQISGDWGGQSIQDYLTAIDSVSKESYVDVNRRAAVGASYGGYSVFMLAGVHNNRFKSFIAHDGVFDTKSWYGTTEEMWFANYDMKGDYWSVPNLSYTKFNPSEYVTKWNTPILIYQGGKDYRTPEGQAQEAFQAAQLRSIQSRLVYLPEENHWVMSAQNALVWQREFFGWLSETLK